MLHPFVRRVASEAAALLDDGHGLSALDVCTGTGVLADEVAKRGYDVTGIDISLSMLAQRRRAREQRGISTLRMDARRLAFADGSFDVCAISMGLHEFSDRDRCRILRELTRVSMKHVLVADYSGRQPWYIRVAEWAEASRLQDFVSRSLRDRLTAMGLRVCRHKRWLSLSMYLCEVDHGT